MKETKKKIRIFKFGGASIKDASGVKNLISVLEKMGHQNTLIVVSAMGKTTNALEGLIHAFLNRTETLEKKIEEIIYFHQAITAHLFEPKHPVFKRINSFITELKTFFKINKSKDYSFIYDQVIGYGELISTTIISHYLAKKGFKNNWLDVRNYIKTDNYYRHAHVNWEATQDNISNGIDSSVLNITQGFLGSDHHNFTTTLGREGSDYTAAIFGYCLEAQSVTIWKDVPGVLNGDPNYFKQTILLERISYSEAIELAFYGASVIHPKTLQPLKRKAIPLYVKSFIDPEKNGTTINSEEGIFPKTPCFILKQNQILLSLSTLDFSYVAEENISDIFNLLHQYKMKVGLIQISAISFSVCFENRYHNLEKLLVHLKAKFKVTCNRNVSLFTIRHYDRASVKKIETNKKILLKQLYKETVQIVTS